MKKLVLSILFISVLTACKKEKVIGPEGPQGPQGSSGNGTPGTITGKITQYDQTGSTYTTGLNTTTVEIQGTNYSAVTDASGSYTLNNVMPGTYNILVNKPGCGTMQKQQVSFPGNGTYYLNTSILEKPTYSFISASVDTFKVSPSSSTYNLKFTINATTSTIARGALILIGQNNTIDVNDPLSYEYANINPITMSATSQFTYGFGGLHGTYYIKIYPHAQIFNGGVYYDVATDKQKYYSYGTPLTPTYSVTIP
ncbi:MAG: carboxypeptidase regulatory-like domain-containing protein [Bacteroidia bacterium]|nr:carboxypeptidase regulatory-like domain-containing protein [Bacteroidia bacterium]